MKSISLKKALIWLLTALCLVGTPAALVFFSVQRYYLLIEDENRQRLKVLLQQLNNESILALDQEQFWCRRLYEKFEVFRREKSSPAAISVWLKEQKSIFPDDFEYILWNKAGEKVSSSLAGDDEDERWRNFIAVVAGLEVGLPPSNFGMPEASMEDARLLVGPQLLRQIFRGQINPGSFSFAWPDSSGQKPPLGVLFTQSSGVVFLFNRDMLSGMSSLQYTLTEFSKRSNAISGFFSTDRDGRKSLWQTKDGLFENNLLSDMEICERDNHNFLERDTYYLGSQYLSPGIRTFVAVARDYSSSAVLLRSSLAGFLYILLMSPFFVYTWKNMVMSKPGSISIRFKLAFLFLFASGIPLLALTIISQEHYSHRRYALMAEAHKDSVETLFSLDSRYYSFLNVISQQLDKFFDELGERLSKQSFTYEISETTREFLRQYEIQHFYIVPSHTKSIAHSSGLYNYRGEFDSAVMDLSTYRLPGSVPGSLKDDLFAANLICKKVMGDLNRVAFSGHTLSKLEIVAESLLQKTFVEITNSIIANLGQINSWGFREVKDLTYFRFISVFEQAITDYAVMVFWRPIILQGLYLRKAVAAANRNPAGTLVFAQDKIFGEFVPKNQGVPAAIVEFAGRLGDKPTEEMEIINFADQEYMAVGFNAPNLDFYRIIQLYPIRNIDHSISVQKHYLILMIVFSLLLAVGLAQILSISFVAPLELLREGALAVEARNFKHRIRGLGFDEFGEVGEIFNEVMVDFEELAVARVVQENLFPSESFVHGKFAVYGKSICMNELGGDYLDFFAIDDNRFSLLIGDVAGHGVGAAVIMAMAKAGILGSRHLLGSPAELLSALHKMILASKSKRQRKIMTFQYLCLDSASCHGTYANAGGCSPYILRNNGKDIEELKLEGAALGAFKKATYSELPLELAFGDAMVFYTDGIVESRDPDGNEIGYEGFKKILMQSYSVNPELFYDNIFSAYKRHVRSEDSQDDLTMIILVCKE